MGSKDEIKGDILLGKDTEYQFEYDASVLFPIPRSEGRLLLGIGDELPFYGADQWTAYEFSWLSATGLPQVAIVEFSFPCSAPNLIESKSFKLYLNTFNQTVFNSQQQVLDALKADLSKVSGAEEVEIKIYGVNNYPIAQYLVNQFEYNLIDDISVRCEHYLPEASLLLCDATEKSVEKKLCSYLFRSLCPVTGQPDWASVYIHYKGQQIIESSLLQYLVSFRNHQGFHEQCVEAIFTDLMRQCVPEELTVYARFLRRGGLDINPFRSTKPDVVPSLREARQ